MPGIEVVKAHLKDRFARAGVPLRFAVRPPVPNGWTWVHPSTMVMDIRKVDRPVRGEVVLLWLGAARLEVPAINARRRQLVLDVEERERVLLIKSRRHPNRWDSMRIPADRRTFLVGMDECHLFMARLPGRTASVANAHDLLAPARVRERRRRGADVPRQGEHFFVPATDEQLEAIREVFRRGFRAGPGAVRPQRDGGAVYRAGKAHWAEQTTFASGQQFVRGVIRHPDHRDLWLQEWARPELNTERPALTPVPGMTWVD